MMIDRIQIALLSVGSLISLSAPAGVLHGQADTGRIVLSGTVIDRQSRPIEGAEVRLVGTSVSSFSSANGVFRLDTPRGTELLLHIRRVGFNAVLLRVRQSWNGTVLMLPGAYQLPEIQVNARNAKPIEYAHTTKFDDFFRRQRRGNGEFITRAEINTLARMNTPEILQGRPGIKVSIRRDALGTIVAFARCHEYPPKINVYVDGRKLNPNAMNRVARLGPRSPFGKAPPPDPEVQAIVGEMLERVNPSEIEFIEIYRGPGELPGEFNDGNCGAIAIWTRTGGQ